MSALLERLTVDAIDGRTPGWQVALDGAPLLHLSEGHVAVNDLRAAHQFHWGLALLRRRWDAAPHLRDAGDAVEVHAGDGRPIVTLRWHQERPAHVEVEVVDYESRLLDLEVRYRQLPSQTLPGVEPAAALGR